MKLTHLFFFVLALCYLLPASAQNIVSKDGREIILNDDGTWEYAPEGILVETEDGKKARLKSDNTWQYVENTELQEQVVFSDQGEKTASTTSIRLKETFITSSGPKATNIIKNSHQSSGLNFVIEVTTDSTLQSSIQIENLDPKSFTVTDSKNKKYKIAEISGTAKMIRPGSTTALQITTTSAPSRIYKTPREVYLNIAENTLGPNKAVRLKTEYRDMERL